MMEFNDQVMMVTDARDIELRGIEVLIKLVPFVENDVLDKRVNLMRKKEEKLSYLNNEVYANNDNLIEARRIVEEWYETAIRKEKERVVRLRRGILERAERVFPELAAEEPQDSFRSVSGGDAGGTGASPHVRCTNYDLRCESKAASPHDSFRSVPGESGGGSLSARGVGECAGFHNAAGVVSRSRAEILP